MSLLALIIWVVVLGIVSLGVKKAPFIDEDFKPTITWICYAAMLVVVIIFLIGIAGAGHVRLN